MVYGASFTCGNLTSRLTIHHVVSYCMYFVFAYQDQHIDMGLPSSKLLMTMKYRPCVVYRYIMIYHISFMEAL